MKESTLGLTGWSFSYSKGHFFTNITDGPTDRGTDGPTVQQLDFYICSGQLKIAPGKLIVWS